MTAIHTIEVVNALWPGGIGLRPPCPAAPYWRTAEGRRHSLSSVRAGCDEATQAVVMRVHLAALDRILAAAAEAELGGNRREARRLVGGATRLCGELVGLWPDGSWGH